MDLTSSLFKSSKKISGFDLSGLNIFCMNITNKAKNIYISRLFTPYHSQDHIVSMTNGLFEYLQNNDLELIDFLDVYFAIIYHDIIYIPGCKSNEKYSAEFASSSMRFVFKQQDNFFNYLQLKNILNDDLIKNVSFLIKRTRIEDHLKECTNEKLKLLLDLDLISLATNKEKFISNQTKIMYENTGDDRYLYKKHPRQKQAFKKCYDFLNSLRNKGHIYRLDYFREKFESKAIANIEGLLELC